MQSRQPYRGRFNVGANAHISGPRCAAVDPPDALPPPNLAVKTSRRQAAFSRRQCQPWDLSVPRRGSIRAPAPRPNSLPGHLGGVFLPRGVTLVPHSEGIALLGLVSKTQQLYPSGLKNAPFEAPSSENHARSGHVGGARIVMGEKLDLRIKRSASARCRAQGGSADSWTSGFPVTRPPQTSRARSLPVSAARLPTR